MDNIRQHPPQRDCTMSSMKTLANVFMDVLHLPQRPQHVRRHSTGGRFSRGAPADVSKTVVVSLTVGEKGFVSESALV